MCIILSQQLLSACADGKIDTLESVLSKSTQVDLNAALPGGLPSPLSIVAITSSPSACKVLVKAGAEVNQVDPSGCSALHWAVLTGHAATVKTLLASGANPGLEDSEVGKLDNCTKRMSQYTTTYLIEMRWLIK